MWRHLPNLITLLRIGLVIPVFVLIRDGSYGDALVIAAVAGISDAMDGFLARRFHWQSRLGSLLDPLADKLLLMASFAALTLTGVLPVWLLLLVFGRDLLIVAGAIGYHVLIGRFDAAPTVLSKLTTAVQITCVLVELLRLSAWADLPWSEGLIVVTALFTVASGIHYVVAWSLRARRVIQQRKQGCVGDGQD